MSRVFAERLKKIRKNRQISQEILSRYLGYGYTAISNYESGRNEPDMDTLVRIARFFDVSVDYLLGNDEKVMFMDRLSLEEKEILRFYRGLQEQEKEALLLILKGINR